MKVWKWEAKHSGKDINLERVVIPENSWVILLLEDTRSVTNDNTVATDFLLQVCGMTGAIYWQQQTSIT